MRILIADNIVDSQILAKLATFGSVDIARNGRDAVLAYVNTASKGIFYELIVLYQHLGILNGFETGEMIRMFESEHRKSGKQTTICIISSNDSYSQHHENGYDKDERTHILGTPLNLDSIESLAASVAAELKIKRHTNFVPV